MAVGTTSQTMDDSQSRNNHEWDHYTIFYWADKIIKLNSPIWILHRWRAGRFLVINRKPIDITKHQQNALQFIELHRTL